jgi:hypothetical protein
VHFPLHVRCFRQKYHISWGINTECSDVEQVVASDFTRLEHFQSGRRKLLFFTGVWICKKATGGTKNKKKRIENRFMLNPGLYSFFFCARNEHFAYLKQAQKMLCHLGRDLGDSFSLGTLKNDFVALITIMI